MGTLRIGFSRPQKSKVFADLIMWWDKRRYDAEIAISHSYARFVSASWERDFIYQAAGFRTEFMGGGMFESINSVIEEYELELTPEMIVKIGQTCVDREGKPYGIRQVLGQILQNVLYLATFGHLEIQNPFADKDAEVTCIEEMAYVIGETLGVEAPFDMDSTSVWPFRCWLSGLPGVKRVK